jgi:predicted lipoprotein
VSGAVESAPARLPSRVRAVAPFVLVAALLVAMVLGTRFVPAGSALDRQASGFSAAAFGRKQFPVVRDFAASRAVDAVELAAALRADPAAAAAKYGVATEGGVGSEIPVRFTGVVGAVPASGFTPITVPGLPAGTTVSVQLGPAIVGTDLRDATGKVRLGDFENQIQYQDAAGAINDEAKKVLTAAGAPAIGGRTVQVIGVFDLVNPATWNVTATALTVQG